MKSINEFLLALVKLGTPLGGLFYGIVGLAIAVLWITMGFWNMFFIILCCKLGAFLGGVKDKKEYIKNHINKLFPPKDNGPLQ